MGMLDNFELSDWLDVAVARFIAPAPAPPGPRRRCRPPGRRPPRVAPRLRPRHRHAQTRPSTRWEMRVKTMSGPRDGAGDQTPGLLLALRLWRDDFPALLRALLGAAQVEEPLTVARVLALARVRRPGAGALSLAGVDARAVDLRRRLVRRARHHGTAQKERCRRTRDEHPTLGRRHPSSSLIVSRLLSE